MLKEVSEGWYIDYKSQELKISDYAKHISAFANQYGGWLLLGVKESDDGRRVASEFIGIPNEKIEQISREIREASAAHCNPEVLYEEEVYDGPIEEIGLDEGKSILIIGIPMSRNTPHIHSSGRIYRRLSDQSKPKEETDRYILDDLWKRGKDYQDKVTNYLKSIPDLPEPQSETPWVHIYLKPASGQQLPEKKLNFKSLSNILNDIAGTSVEMDSINSTVDGFVARHMGDNDPSLATLSFRWWHDGRFRMDIPLNQYDITNFSRTENKNKYLDEFFSLIDGFGYKNIKIIDCSPLSNLLAALVNIYLNILEHLTDTRDIYSCFTLRNVFYIYPYFDSKKFLERAQKYSLPVSTEKVIRYPIEPKEQTMILHKRKLRFSSESSFEERLEIPYLFSGLLFYKILESLGVVSDVADINDEDFWASDRLGTK
jgi:hypothetical protein